MSKAGIVSFNKARTFNLDEYVGLPANHPQSYSRFMWDNLFTGLGFRPDQPRLLDGMADDLSAECERYEREIEKAGNIDLQLLGIGHNGHIGFNEPSDAFKKRTHVARLTKHTVEANKRFFNSPDEVPATALSMGIGTIMRSSSILLTAFGKEKAGIIREAFLGDVAPRVSASILQFHCDCTIVLDKDAASLL